MDDAESMLEAELARNADNGDEPDGEHDDDGAVFVDRGRLLVKTLFRAITVATPLALHPSDGIWCYDRGRYVDGRGRVAWLVAQRLGDRFKRHHLADLVSYAEAQLGATGSVLASTPTGRLVNVENGMLDPFTGELAAHDPRYLSVAQLPVPWQPDADCPTFDGWLADVVPNPELRAALLEDAGTLLDLRGLRHKRALFLEGPTHSGKSTFARLLEAIAGIDNRSSEELADLTNNRFRAASLFGKVLNVASDISAEHLADVGLFKKATGADTISAERKFGHPFAFRFGGLFVFTMNAVPTVGDTSTAYLARIRPYRFPVSFLGRENPEIEASMMNELPGILARLVVGLQVLEARGGYYVSDTTRAQATWFAHQSDRVALFLAEATIAGGWTKRGKVHDEFTTWAKDRHRGGIGRNALYAALESRGLPVVTRNGERGFPLTLIGDYDIDPTATVDLARVRELQESALSAPDGAISDGSGATSAIHANPRTRARPDDDPSDEVGRMDEVEK